jgi:hypothetical protein
MQGHVRFIVKLSVDEHSAALRSNQTVFREANPNRSSASIALADLGNLCLTSLRFMSWIEDE